MEKVLSYREFVSGLPAEGKCFLLLYRGGSEQSACACKNVGKVAEGNDKIRFFSADVNEVRDIHSHYGFDSVPSLLVFDDGRLTGVVKGCHDSSYYLALIQNSLYRPDTESGNKPARTVTVYSTPACSWCNTLKAWLNKNGIQYTDIDVSRDQAGAEAMVRRSGQQGVPQTDIDGQIVVGFDQPRLKELLKIQ